MIVTVKERLYTYINKKKSIINKKVDEQSTNDIKVVDCKIKKVTVKKIDKNEN